MTGKMEMVLRRALTVLAALLSAPADAAALPARRPPRTPAPELFVSKYKPGTIVVRIRQRRLYHLTGPGQAVSYSVGAARPGIQFYGRTVVTQKREPLIANWKSSGAVFSQVAQLFGLCRE